MDILHYICIYIALYMHILDYICIYITLYMHIYWIIYAYARVGHTHLRRLTADLWRSCSDVRCSRGAVTCSSLRLQSFPSLWNSATFGPQLFPLGLTPSLEPGGRSWIWSRSWSRSTSGLQGWFCPKFSRVSQNQTTQARAGVKPVLRSSACFGLCGPLRSRRVTRL